MNYSLTVDEQKQLAGIMFNKLRAFDPYCILAGGAPRDWYFGKEATDLDFFLYQQNERATVREIETRLKSLGLKYKLKFANEIPHYEKNENIRCVADIEELWMPIQLVIMRKPTFSIVEKFPFNMCQTWYTPERGIKVSKDFQLGVKTKMLWITDKLYNNQDAYVKKITSKFSDYKLVFDKQVAIDYLIQQ